jgi:riboflavin kinase/FMN adenylyltransferase
MQVLRGLDALPLPNEPAAVTVGMFDGVHRGHQAVIGRTSDVAHGRGARTVAVTFDRHPREILTPGREPPLLTTLERKIELIGALGVDALLVLEFTEGFSRVPAEEFISRVLADGLHAVHAVIGTNFTFGHKARGNLALLSELGPSHGFSVEGVELIEIDGRRVSSSSIREALAAGELEWPRTALGRRYAVDGRVVMGAGRGAGLGYPTANLETHPRLLLPREGVYAGKASVGPDERVAAINVGSNPTFGEEKVHVEAFLLDFARGIVGEDISVEFWERLRDEERFDSKESLMRQIAEDVLRTLEVVR